MVVIGFALAWLTGIYLGSTIVVPTEAVIVWSIVCGFLILVWWRHAIALRLILCSMVVAVALWRGHGAADPQPGTLLAPYVQRGPVYLRGVVDDDPASRGQTLEVRLDVREARADLDDPWEAVEGIVLLQQGSQPQRHYGELLEAFGPLEGTDHLSSLTYGERLKRQGIAAVMRYPKIVVVGDGYGWLPLSLLHGLREKLAAALEKSLPEPQASLATGILLGKRANIADSLMTSFARTNTTHVIAISGANISLVAAILLVICRFLLGRRLASIAAILGIAAYALMVGTAPSVVRASFMGVLYVAGAHYGRQRDTTSALGLAAVAMTIHDPSVLFDLGFQLSFLGTAGLVLLEPLLRPKLSRLPAWLAVIIAPTLAAEATTMPLIAQAFGQLSVVGPLANLIVPPLLPAVMLSAGVTALAGAFSQLAGQLAAAFAWLFLSAMTFAVDTLSAVPFAALPIGRTGSALVIAYYALLVLAMLKHSRPTNNLHALWQRLWSHAPTVPTITGLTLIAVVMWSAVVAIPPETVRLSVLDVGQGDAILVQTPRHKILVDGGPNPDAVANDLGRSLPFWDRDIDLVVLTHPNEDHLAGLITVLERYDVHTVLDTNISQPSPTYLRFQQLIRERSVKHVAAEAGQRIDMGDGVVLTVMHAGKPGDGGDTNDSSIVLRVAASGFSALLTGDIGQTARRQLLAAGDDLQATILKVPHHGSSSGLDDEFLSAVAPEVAVVSVGRGNRFGHPAVETLRLLDQHQVRTYRTDVNGTTQIIQRQDGYEVSTQR